MIDPTDKLLIDESPLMFQAGLAVLFGDSEAILLQQLHWWITQGYPDEKMPIAQHEGRRYRRIPPHVMAHRLPFWEERNIRRLIANLKETGVLLTENLNEPRSDTTSWYAIDRDRLREIAATGKTLRKKPGRKPKDAGSETNSSGHAMIAGRPVQSLHSGTALNAPPYKDKEKQQELVQQDNSTADADGLANALFEAGIRPRQLCADLAHIEGAAQQLEWWPLRRGEVEKWTPGTLRATIEQQWAAPHSVAPIENHSNGSTPKPTAEELAAERARLLEAAQAVYDALPVNERRLLDIEAEERREPVAETTFRRMRSEVNLMARALKAGK